MRKYIIPIILILVLPFVMGAVDDAILYFSCDGDLADTSGYAVNAGKVGAVGFNTTSKALGTASCDVNNQGYITSNRDSSANWVASNTICAWVYSNTAAPSAFIQKGTDAGGGYYFRVHTTLGFTHGITTAGLSETYLAGTFAKQWDYWCFMYNGTHHSIWRNASEMHASAKTGNVVNKAENLSFGSNGWAGNYLGGGLDEIVAYNHTLTTTDMAYLMLNNPYGGGAPPPSTNFSVNALDNITSATLYNLTVTVNVTKIFYSTNGTAITDVDATSTALLDVSVCANDSGGYHCRYYPGTAATSNLAASLGKRYRLTGPRYIGAVVNTSSFVYNLTYQINVTCVTEDTVLLERYINLASNVTPYANLNQSTNLSCNNATITVTDTYTHDRTGPFNISFRLNTTYRHPLNNLWRGAALYYSDLATPSIFWINFTIPTGFVQPNNTMSVACSDAGINYVNLTYYWNGAIYFSGNVANGSNMSNLSNLRNGWNNIRAICSDAFGRSVQSIVNLSIVFNSFYLWDEKENTPFNINNISSAKVYFNDNSTSYDFKAANVSSVNMTSTVGQKLRFELGYTGNVFVNRYIDTEYLSNFTDLKVCANKQGITHYEQAILSSSKRPVFVISTFAQCYVGVYQTEFAYQEAYMLKVYTTDGLYYLYTYDADTTTQVFLASLDGTVASYINIDTLEFQKTAYDTSLRGDILSWEPLSNHSIYIWYYNSENTNTAVNVRIYRVDNSTVVFNTSLISNPNNFSIYFDWSTLHYVTNNTLFKIEIDRTTASGMTTKKAYLTIQQVVDGISPQFAFVVSLFVFIFGLTFTASRFTFGYFGIFIMLGGLAVLGAASLEWYSKFLMGMYVITLVYLVVVMARGNQQAVV